MISVEKHLTGSFTSSRCGEKKEEEEGVKQESAVIDHPEG